MKLMKIAYTGLAASVLLTECTKEETKVEEANSEVTKVNNAKVWKDVSTPEGFNNYGIEPTLEG
ncbi:hypothetical protein ACIQZG_14915 [Lysinibacillus sp. NPDC096418]|uniref:hypothetical protein n=1 Tax=Lysinibacillus sp. NPDC096418 TaxID=3364138 RepID=UPI003823E087